MTIKSPPIAMTYDNFCAIVDPRSPNPKTETRRLLKIRNLSQELTNELQVFYPDGDGNWIGCSHDSPDQAEFVLREYPKGCDKGIKSPLQIGDRCYLTEPTQIESDIANSFEAHVSYFWHKSEIIWQPITGEDSAKILNRKSGVTSKQIARFMLKSFARYWVEITDVRIERLLDITAEAAIAEGIKAQPRWHDATTIDYFDYCKGRFVEGLSPIDSYLSEIAYIHKSTKDKIGGWDLVKSNPLVWVYKFKLV